MVLGSEKSWSEKKMFRPRKAFSGAGQTELRARYPIMPGLESSCRRGFRLQRRGEEKNLFGPDNFFFDFGPETLQHRQDKPTQAKGSLWGQMAFSESGWRLAEAVL